MVDVSSQNTGATESEKYLTQLCKKSFLSLWSYPNPFRDQGRNNGQGDGKELCDLLVVFGKHILIFSDKECQFGDSGNISVDWNRWYKKAIEKSAEQIWGAERWIKSYPSKIFTDRKCTQPLLIDLPEPSTAIFHRIVVAHGASKKCKDFFGGGSGSLMLNPKIVGSNHYIKDTNISFKNDEIDHWAFEYFADNVEKNVPFQIGLVDPSKGYIHVFDDTTLDILLQTLNTITDFVTYIEKKESFLQSKNAVLAVGEEELLAIYLSKIDNNGRHNFVLPNHNVNSAAILEGFWDSFQQNPQRLAQLEADKISYAWDELIEIFTKHAIEDTQYFSSEPRIEHTEKILRFMAQETRFRRRYLATRLLELVKIPKLNARLIFPEANREQLCYVFLVFPRSDDIPYEDYRERRLALLTSYCTVAKLHCPQVKDIVGIATEPFQDTERTQDTVYLDVREWTSQDQNEAEELRSLGLFKDVRKTHSQETEYPELANSTVLREKNPRNKPCLCGSGKKYKHCCLRKNNR